MEKLQRAIDKARERRGASPATSRTHRDAPARSSSADEEWVALGALQPPVELASKHRIVTLTASPDSTHFDVLRTKLQLEMRKHGWRRIAITSPTAACGKTTIAANLAAGLGRHEYMRTILFELDLRRPSLAKIFGQLPERDIHEVISGEADFADCALRMGGNVAVAMARKPVSDPSKTLIRKETSAIIDAIDKRYQPDMMIFDLPPLLVTDDTRAFLRNVDCALIVVRAGLSTAAELDICEREISEHTNVVGSVLNGCRYSDTGAGYDYGNY